MSVVLNLKSLVDKDMGDLIAKYMLSVIRVSEEDVLLKASNFSIRVLADRDGVSMIYFDTARRPVKGYNIFIFLINKRRRLLTFLPAKSEKGTYPKFIEDELVNLVRHLKSAGQDILEGSKDWIAAYSWPSVSAPESLVGLMI